MPKPFSFGEIHLDVDVGRSNASAASDPDTPFHLLILGDFSGRASRKAVETGAALSRRKAGLVARDNLDDVLAAMHVDLDVPVAGRIRCTQLEDFHPDRLYASQPFFDKLKLAREEAHKGTAKPVRKKPARTAPPPPDMLAGSFLDQAVEETESRVEKRPPATKDPFQSWVSNLVEPDEEAAGGQGRTEVDELIDKATNAQMRSLLHFPAFQALEAAWRGVDFLARRIETDSTLKIFLLDVSKDELTAGLESAADVGSTGACALLTRYARDVPWAAICCNYRFGAGDVNLLARLGTISRAIGAPLIAEASASLAGDAAEPVWEELRSHPSARGLGLVFPRFLLRLPYGNHTVPCDDIAFEEMSGEPEHERYLWGNPALVCAVLLAESFRERGWRFRPGERLNLTGLPLHSYRKDGEPALQPCAETLMTERTAERLLDRGLMPLASLKDSDEVRLVRFQSIANPAAPLAGRWA